MTSLFDGRSLCLRAKMRIYLGRSIGHDLGMIIDVITSAPLDYRSRPPVDRWRTITTGGGLWKTRASSLATSLPSVPTRGTIAHPIASPQERTRQRARHRCRNVWPCTPPAINIHLRSRSRGPCRTCPTPGGLGCTKGNSDDGCMEVRSPRGVFSLATATQCFPLNVHSAGTQQSHGTVWVYAHWGELVKGWFLGQSCNFEVRLRP